MPNLQVFTNGPVLRPDGGVWEKATVVVRDARIVDVVPEVTHTTQYEVIDLQGRLLVPGFQDAHVHPGHGGLRRLRCDMTDLTDRNEALERIRAAALGPDEWVLGGGWAFAWFERGCPPAETLDELTGDKPAYLVVRDGHSAWANTAALARAGVDAGTIDPPDGRIERRPDGSPQGTLHEGAMHLVARVAPPTTPAEIEAAIVEGQRVLFSRGVTAWQDAWVTDLEHGAYRKLDAAGRLVAQVRGAYWWDRERGLDQLEDIRSRLGEGAGAYHPGAVKLMLDGVVENFTASMLQPYVGDHGEGGDHSGIDFIDPADLREIVAALDGAGIQCHFHAIGDGAVRAALDAVEHARRLGADRGLRHHLAHLQVVHPADVHRFGQLGVWANCQPLWACNEPAMTDLTIPFLGDRRVRTQYPFRSISRTGRLAMGSDWPVSSPDVMEQIHVAVHRTPPADPSAEPFLPEEALTLSEALVAFTRGSAEVNHLDRERGAIAVGNVADLVVLDSNPFERLDDLAGVGVDLTMVSGQVVYDSGNG